MYGDRTDPRLTYRDLIFRMYPDQAHGLMTTQAMSMQRTRFRDLLGLACWVKRTDYPSLNEMLKTEQLSLNSVRRNTSLPVRPWGLVRPVLEPGTFPVAPLPLNFFTGRTQTHVPSPRLVKVFNEIAKLQDIAFDQGYAHWLFLPNHDKPSAWNNKAESQHRSSTGPGDVTFPEEAAIPRDALDWIKECVVLAASGESGMAVPNVQVLPRHAIGWVSDCIQEGQDKAAALAATPANTQAAAPPSDSTSKKDRSADLIGEEDNPLLGDFGAGVHGEETGDKGGEESGDKSGRHNDNDVNGSIDVEDEEILSNAGFDEDVYTDDIAEEIEGHAASTTEKSHNAQTDPQAINNKVTDWLKGSYTPLDVLADHQPGSRKRGRTPDQEYASPVKRQKTGPGLSPLQEVQEDTDQPIEYLARGKKRGREPDTEPWEPSKRPRTSSNTHNALFTGSAAQAMLTGSDGQALWRPTPFLPQLQPQSVSASPNMRPIGISNSAIAEAGSERVVVDPRILTQQYNDPFMGDWWLPLPQSPGRVFDPCEDWPSCGGPSYCSSCR